MMEMVLYMALGLALAGLFGVLRRRYASFLAQSPSDYADADTVFDLRRHLEGDLKCDGVIYGPMGRVVSRFVGDFRADWSADKGVMREHFRYDDGTVRDREWQLTLHGSDKFEARAADVVGVGQGVVSGPTVRLRYRLRMPEDSGGHVLNTVDWMYLTPEGTVVNRSQFRILGVQVAELVAVMRRVEAIEAPVQSEAA